MKILQIVLLVTGILVVQSTPNANVATTSPHYQGICTFQGVTVCTSYIQQTQTCYLESKNSDLFDPKMINLNDELSKHVTGTPISTIAFIKGVCGEVLEKTTPCIK
jgi:hypothetical protein